MCNEIIYHINAVTEWTQQRQRDWVEHNAVVHGFIRTVIRVDSQRRLTSALKRSIVRVPEWSLLCAGEPKFFRFRDVETEPKQKVAPKFSRRDFKREVKEVPFDTLRSDLGNLLEDSLQEGEANLSKLLRTKAQLGVPLHKLAFQAPWLVARMIKRGKFDKSQKEWIKINSDASVQEFRVTKK